MVKFIADIGSNHNQSFIRALQLIHEAKEIGCWGVKFQLFDPEGLWADDHCDREKLRKQALPVHWIPYLKEYCDLVDIKFGCTPFYLEAVDILRDHVDFLKIGSFEVTYDSLVDKCLLVMEKTWIELFISIGLIKPHTLTDHYKIFLNTSDYRVHLMHCVSNYPALPENVGFDDMYHIGCENICGDCGNSRLHAYSDHTAEPGVIYAAVAKGAEWIEFHLDLHDGNGLEFGHGHCWIPSYMQRTIQTVRIMEIALNSDTKDMSNLNNRMDPSDGLRPLKEFRK